MELKRSLSTVVKSDNQFMDQYLRQIKMFVDSLIVINSPVTSHDLIQHIIMGLDSD